MEPKILEFLEEKEIKQNKFYIYRFVNYDNDITYVGRTTNLSRRFLNHSHLTDDIKKVEYIECNTEADMIWKEIYYINLFFNKHSTNVSNVYGTVTDLMLNDIWKIYHYSVVVHHFNEQDMIDKSNIIKNVGLSKYSNLINIIDHKKINRIGENKFDLSKDWYLAQQNESSLKELSNNVNNYFRNIMSGKTINCMWTTYYESKYLISGKGFKKGFIGLNDLSTKLNSNSIYLAYLCNNFYPQSYTQRIFPESTYALIEILHFISHSAIRDGKEIWIYIPSIRMRNLLNHWILENS